METINYHPYYIWKQKTIVRSLSGQIVVPKGPKQDIPGKVAALLIFLPLSPMSHCKL